MQIFTFPMHITHFRKLWIVYLTYLHTLALFNQNTTYFLSTYTLLFKLISDFTQFDSTQLNSTIHRWKNVGSDITFMKWEEISLFASNPVWRISNGSFMGIWLMKERRYIREMQIIWQRERERERERERKRDKLFWLGEAQTFNII